MKVDKLSSTKTSAVNPSCPPHVRRAKHIARHILTKVGAISVGDEIEVDWSENDFELQEKYGKGSNMRNHEKRKYFGAKKSSYRWSQRCPER